MLVGQNPLETIEEALSGTFRMHKYPLGTDGFCVNAGLDRRPGVHPHSKHHIRFGTNGGCKWELKPITRVGMRHRQRLQTTDIRDERAVCGLLGRGL